MGRRNLTKRRPTVSWVVQITIAPTQTNTMPAAAAAALLDWQPVLVLEKENYALREENRHLHFEIQELMAWKERALKQMLALGPKRQRANRDVRHATQLQRQLQDMEKSLLERSALDHTNQLLQESQCRLEQRISELEVETSILKQQLLEANERESTTRAQMQQLADQFRTHLEELVAMRERIDGERSEALPVVKDSTDSPSSLDTTQDEDLVLEDATVLVAGLRAVSNTCLRWFHQHVADTFVRLHEKAALYEAQHTELEQLRSRVYAIRHDVDFSVAKEKQQAQQLLKLQHDKAELEVTLQKLRTVQGQQQHGQLTLSDHVRLLVTEVRQYLRLVRAEIKKKFGYVPEAITHAENWARILDAMDVLERQLRIAHA